MFRKRAERLQRLSEELDRLRGNSGAAPNDAQAPSSEDEPRRVPNSAFFSRIAAMRQKGGTGEVPGR
jgi:hypothetical protein